MPSVIDLSSELHATLEVLARHGVQTEHFAQVRADPDGYGKRISEAFLGCTVPVARKKTTVPFSSLSPHAQWERAYQICCSKKVDCAGIVLPPRPDYPSWPIIVHPEVPLNTMFAGISKRFSCKSHMSNDLEAVVDWAREERDGRREPYGIWVRANVEADEDLKNFSANSIQEQQIKTVTLHERICLEGFYWVLTGHKRRGKHLDMNNVTYCTGSRCRDGNVPNARWHEGVFQVYWYYAWYASPYLRARLAVPI